MNPAMILLGLAALAGAAYAFRKPSGDTDIVRAAKMERLAAIIYQIMLKKASGDNVREGIELAKYFQLLMTAQGLPAGVLPTSEMWPGTKESVAAFMAAYKKARELPPAPKPKSYNDEAVFPPFPDPRAFRQKALQLEKQGKKTEAKIYHTKADATNKLIRAAKLTRGPSKAVATGKNILAALTDTGK